jgi:hypothetical protein
MDEAVLKEDPYLPPRHVLRDATSSVMNGPNLSPPDDAVEEEYMEVELTPPERGLFCYDLIPLDFVRMSWLMILNRGLNVQEMIYR